MLLHSVASSQFMALPINYYGSNSFFGDGRALHLETWRMLQARSQGREFVLVLAVTKSLRHRCPDLTVNCKLKRKNYS